MGVLDSLLRMELPKPEIKEFKLKRLSALCGEPIVFSLQELGYSRVGEIKSLHESDGEMGIYILLAGVVQPDLKDKSLLEKFGAVTPAELVKKMLRPGEIEDISRQIEQLSGYRTATIEEVKKK